MSIKPGEDTHDCIGGEIIAFQFPHWKEKRNRVLCNSHLLQKRFALEDTMVNFAGLSCKIKNENLANKLREIRFLPHKKMGHN